MPISTSTASTRDSPRTDGEALPAAPLLALRPCGTADASSTVGITS